MKPGPGEPAFDDWRVSRLDEVAASLPRGVVAVDGRGGSGKSTLAARLAERVPQSAVVHTDDVAWFHSRFGWDDLMIGGILTPFRAGDGVRYQPPAWAPRGRTGEIVVPAEATTLFIEGVGASRNEYAERLDFAIWVQSDYQEARRRGIDRDRRREGTDEETALRLWMEWEEEEIPFLIADRPWERANVIVAAAQVLPHDSATEVVVAESGVRA